MQKPEFPTLLSPGFHQFSLNEMSEAFVVPFASSLRRPILAAGLTSFIDEVKSLTIAGELWFDGSFVTEKSEPDDIDLVVVFEPTSIAQLTAEQQQKAAYLFHQPSARAKYNCDVYAVPSNDIVAVSYWRGWFGFKRDGKTAKGIGLIAL